MNLWPFIDARSSVILTHSSVLWVSLLNLYIRKGQLMSGSPSGPSILSITHSLLFTNTELIAEQVVRVAELKQWVVILVTVTGLSHSVWKYHWNSQYYTRKNNSLDSEIFASACIDGRGPSEDGPRPSSTCTCSYSVLRIPTKQPRKPGFMTRK